MNCMDVWIHCMLCGSEWRGVKERDKKIEKTKEEEKEEDAE